MEVNLISYTPDAKELLLFTKNTRLQSEGVTLEDIKAWPEEEKQKELDYMLGTIQSSWEFVNYVFEIRGVSRAFTHQLVRTRTASFAQQSQRAVDMVDFDFVYPQGVDGELKQHLTDEILPYIKEAYKEYSYEYSSQVARSILPTNVATNIIAGANLRTLSDMAKVRLCTRTQGEYQDVFRAIRQGVLNVHPWAEPFLRVYCAAVGVCCFPNYKECPIKPGIFNPDTGKTWQYYPEDTILDDDPLTKDDIQTRWENVRYEANPQQKDPS